MTLRLHDTATRSTRAFVPLRTSTVSLYVCGATVQSPPHIGHLRSAVDFDVLHRWLAASGSEVSMVRNVTDIEDKILAKAAAAGRPWWEWATTHERAFSAAYRMLNCLPPAAEPRATGHITEMIELMQRLIAADAAYASNGDVYFSVEALADYGALSGQRPEEVQQGEASEATTGKHDPRDFTLWKSAKEGEPSWPSPWGPGRPGWHLECSAMSTRYLGSSFDIHGGGLDLIFPHHENERAQSHAAGDGFARYWLHNSLVTQGGEKMSKSVGNTLSMDALLGLMRPAELRYYLISGHYRSPLECTDEVLADAAAGYRRIESMLRRVSQRLGRPEARPACAEFTAAMDDDLSTPAALAAIHTVVRAANTAIEQGSDAAALGAAGSVRHMMSVLGMDPLAEPASGQDTADTGGREALGRLVELLLEERQRARAERNFALADMLRDRLTAAGIVVEDTPDGAQWNL